MLIDLWIRSMSSNVTVIIIIILMFIAHKSFVFVESKLIEEWFPDLIDVANYHTWKKNLRRQFQNCKLFIILIESFLRVRASAEDFPLFSTNKPTLKARIRQLWACLLFWCNVMIFRNNCSAEKNIFNNLIIWMTWQ